jgi:ribosomal-protein-alanine N-acetyltransferase
VAYRLTVTTTVRENAPVTVRPAARADLLEVFRIEQSVFPQPWPFSAFERHLDATAFLVATDESAAGETDSGVVADGVVGYVVADSVPNHGRALGYVKDIAVDADHRERGVGSTLLNRAMSVLAARGASSVKLEVRRSNDAAQSLYEVFGFEHLKTVPRYYANGEDALVLVYEVPDRRDDHATGEDPDR